MMSLQDLPVPQVHVHAAGQARVETAYRAHDINSLEFIGTVFFEDRRILHRVLVRPWSSVNIPWVGIPWSGRIGMVVGDFAILNNNVVREHAADGFVEAAAD